MLLNGLKSGLARFNRRRTAEGKPGVQPAADARAVGQRYQPQPGNGTEPGGLAAPDPSVGILFLFSLLGGYLFENVNASAIALLAKTTNPLLKPVPMWLLKVVIYILHPQNARYMVMPLAAMLLILIGSAYFVSDVYHLSKPGLGWRYVIASMFAVRYPTLTVDGGKKQIKADEVNLLDVIGGPGYALIQPGNAVLFRTLRQPSQTSITSSYFMSPFETIGQIVNLDDQHGYVEEATTITRDGIRVILRDINFRFRIFPEMRNGTSDYAQPGEPVSFFAGRDADHGLQPGCHGRRSGPLADGGAAGSCRGDFRIY